MDYGSGYGIVLIKSSQQHEYFEKFNNKPAMDWLLLSSIKSFCFLNSLF